MSLTLAFALLWPAIWKIALVLVGLVGFGFWITRR